LQGDPTHAAIIKAGPIRGFSKYFHKRLARSCKTWLEYKASLLKTDGFPSQTFKTVSKEKNLES
jgi:hypothetical protein